MPPTTVKLEGKLEAVIIALLDRIANALERIADVLEAVMGATEGWVHLIKMLIDLGTDEEEVDPGVVPS